MRRLLLIAGAVIGLAIVIAATIVGRMPRAKPSDNTIRYNFVSEDGKWKIDDISGTIDGEAWSIRDILTESLKEVV